MRDGIAQLAGCLLVLLLAGCEASLSLPPGTVTVDPNPYNPFSALVTVSHDEDVTIHAVAGEEGAGGLQTPSVQLAAGDATELLLLGLEADRRFEIRAVATSGQRIWISDPEVFVTDPLPDGFPEVETSVAPGESPDPVEVLCTNGHRHASEFDKQWGTYFCFDRDGSPVWSLEHEDGHALLSVRATSDGGFAAVDDSDSLLALYDRRCAPTREYVPLWFEGRTRFQHTWIDMHEVIELTEGPWAGALAFLTGVGDTLPDGRFLLGYGLIVFDPAAEEVRWDWMSHGVLGDGEPIDPALDYDRVSPFLDEAADWLHGNALVHGLDADGGQFFWMSLRHQDWLIKIDVETDEVVWRLGAEGDFELVDDLDAADPEPLSPALWMSHQHSPEIVSRDGARYELVLFDNGNLRRDDAGAWDWDAEPYSRVAGFALDEATLRATPTFALGASDPADPGFFFSQIRGDADLLPGGDRLLYLAGNELSSFVAEVTYPGGEERWRAELPGQGYSYRVAWFPSLYDTTWAYRSTP